MQVVLADTDPGWPVVHDRLRRCLGQAIGGGIRGLEHVGSTAVPELAAKPVIDIVVTVDDPTDEDAYLPAVESTGFVLRHREPDWHEHLIFRLDDPSADLHVFSNDCVEVVRMPRFRDHLRERADDRRRDESVKRSLAARDWPTVQDHADAEGEIVEEILGRAGQSDT